MFNKRLIILGVIVGISAAFFSYVMLNQILEDSVILPTEQTATITEKNDSNNILNIDIVNAVDENYKDWQKQKRERALAVIVDNAEAARPQKGLQKADLVYEYPIEGGATRLLALFSRHLPEEIGPIRSARPYIVDLALEHSAFLVHAGGSEAALEYITKTPLNNLNAIGGGVDRAFWRIKENPIPHNLYSNGVTLRRVTKELKMSSDIQYKDFNYYDSISEVTGDKSKSIDIYHTNKEFQVSYDYNEEKGVYLRRTSLKSSGIEVNPIQVPNIIIKYVEAEVIDGEGRLKLGLLGQGEALFFRGGKVVKGNWVNKNGGTTQYTDGQGQYIKFLNGPIWVHIIAKNTRVDY